MKWKHLYQKRSPRTHPNLLIFLPILLLAACNSGQSQAVSKPVASQANPDPDPVELNIWFTSSVPQSDKDFDDVYRNLIRTKYPHITLNFLPLDAGHPDNSFAKMIAANKPIDLVISSIGTTAANLLNNELQFDISDLIKKYNYDLSQIEPTTTAIQRQLANNGIYGLPLSTDTMTMFYNRDLFNKFGVSFPRDGMTWEETYELVKKMSRTDNGTQYWGMGISASHALQMDSLSPVFIDPQNQTLLSSDTFKRAMQNITGVFQIPGNKVDTKTWSYAAELAMFQKEQNLATLLGTSALGPAYFADKNNLNWDVVAYPRYSDAPKVGPQTYPVYTYVSSISKHKDDAFKVAAYMTTKEFQVHLAQMGVLPISADASIMKQEYGKKLPYMADKNISAFLPDKFASPAYKGIYQSIGTTAVVAAFQKIVLDQTDINTALREADEYVNQKIKEQQEAMKK